MVWSMNQSTRCCMSIAPKMPHRVSRAQCWERMWSIVNSIQRVSYEERCKIDTLKKEGLSLTQIAKRPGCRASRGGGV